MVDETPTEHVKAHEHRQKVGEARQKKVEERADKSDTRQDDSDTRQDVGEKVVAQNTRKISQGQNQQDITNLITNAHTEQIQGMQAEALAQHATQYEQQQNLDRIIEGVDFLAIQATTLNERVYTKNYLDRIRNYMIAGAIITFVFVSVLLGSILYTSKIESNKEASRAQTRASEALTARKQIADCTVEPGVLLEDDTINPGECYKKNQEAIGKYLESLKISISEEVKKLLITQAEATAANKNFTKAVRDDAAAQANALKSLLTTTTSTIKQSFPPPLPPPSPPPPSSSPPTTIVQDPGLLCKLLVILGLCNA